MPAAPSTDWIADAIAALPPICTAKEAMALLRVSKRTLCRMVADGRVHALHQVERGSSRLLIPRASLEKYLRLLDP